MIQEALQFASRALNQYVKNKFGLDDNCVLVNTIVDPSGEVPLENQNKVVLSLIHIEQETLKPYYNRSQKLINGNYAVNQPSERYNLFMLVTPSFDDYNESLKFLNASIEFFQNNPTLDSTTNANIPPGITKLDFDLQKGGGYTQMHNLWNALGAKYQPSVIYKIRLVTVESDEIKGFTTSISTTQTDSIV